MLHIKVRNAILFEPLHVAVPAHKTRALRFTKKKKQHTRCLPQGMQCLHLVAVAVVLIPLRKRFTEKGTRYQGSAIRKC